MTGEYIQSGNSTTWIDGNNMAATGDVKYDQQWTPPSLTNRQRNQPVKRRVQGHPKVMKAQQQPRKIQPKNDTTDEANDNDLSEVTRNLVATMKSPYVEMVRCPKCGKEMRSRYVVEKHMRVHTGNYFIRCEICQQGFDARRQLQRHMKKHSGFPVRANIKNEKF